MRITPRITPHIPNPRNISPSNLARSAPRAVLTGNFPHPSVGGISGASGVTGGASLSTLTTASSTGRPRKVNAKPKTAAQISGIKTTTRLPRSMVHAAPGDGPRTVQGVKMKVHKIASLKPHLNL